MFELSKKFFNQFDAIFSEDNPKRTEAVCKYTNNSAFTTFITNELNSIISSLGYTPQNEYYRIDAMGYTNRLKTLDKSKLLSPHLWDLEIAVEHENSSKDWLDEVIKLAHIYCPLRVVIGYVPVDQRGCGDRERLDYVTNVLKQLKCKETFKHGEFMVVLGNSNTKDNEDNFFNYKAYVLNKQTLAFISLDNCT